LAEFPSAADLQATPGTIGSGTTPSDESDTREALDVVDALREEFKDRDKVLEDIEKVIYLENAVEIPVGYMKTALEVRSPLPAHIVNTITSALTVNPPSVVFDQIGIGDAALENQALRQRFFDASWHRQESEAKRPIFRLVGHSVIGYGEGVIKTVERKKRVWAQYNGFSKKLRADLDATELDSEAKDQVFNARTEEFKRGAAYPIASTDVPPNTFYYLKGEDGFNVCCEVKQIPYLDAVERFAVGVNSAGDIVPQAMGLPYAADCYKALGNQRTVEIIEIWDWQKVRYLVRGAKQKDAKRGLLVKTLKHGYGDKDLKVLRGPYFHSLGVTTSSREIYKQSQSVLFAFLRLFPLLDRLLTIRGQAAVTYGFGAFKRVRPSGTTLGDAAFGIDAGERSATEEEIRPGFIYPDDIQPINMPSGGIDLDKAIADVRAMIELALPSVAQGVVGGESGYAINQAAHLARLAWNPIIANLEQMLAERVGFESWLIENRIKEKVWVYGSVPEELRATNRRRSRPDDGWLGIEADDLGGLHRYRVKLKPETPSNQVIDIRMQGDMLKMQVISKRQATENLGQNPFQTEREILFEELKADPAIKGLIKTGVFQRLATMQASAMQGVDAEVPGGAAPQGAPGPDQQMALAPPDPGQMAAAPNGTAPPIPQGPVAPGGALPGTPGTVAGAPGGVRNYPAGHLPLPGA
jgi:hypothetical protein